MGWRKSGQADGKCTQKHDLPAAGSFGRTKAKGGRGFYLGDKKKLFGEFAKSGLRSQAEH